MKKSILILVTALFLLAGCNKDTDTTATIYWSLSTALCPGDVPDEVLSVDYLYYASNEKEFILNTYDYQPSDVMGDPVNYSIKEGWAELNTGEKEHYKYFSDELNSPYNYGEFKNVAPGRYLIVIFKEYNAFQTTTILPTQISMPLNILM
jgi:hypothetical protein